MDQVAKSGGFLTLLKKRNFLRLWLAQLISLTIFNASNYALIILIGGDQDKGSTIQIGIAIICFSLPAILFGVPAGVVVDHIDRRLVLWASNGLRALTTLLFVGTLLFARGSLLPIYLLTFLISAISQFFTPAEGSTIPLLVNEEELAPALSLFNVTFMLSQALGFVLLGPTALSLLPSFTIHGIIIDRIVLLYAIVALLYLVCSFLILLIPKRDLAQSGLGKPVAKTGPLTQQTVGAVKSMMQEMYQGWTFVRGNKPLFQAVVQLSFAGVLILVIGELATPIVTKLLFLNANAMAFVFAPAGIGLVGGSILMPRITRRLGKSRTVFSGSIILTMATLFLPLTTLVARALQPHDWKGNPTILIIIAVWMFAAGVALGFINIPAQTAIQERTPNWIKGRVLALQLILYNACAIPVIFFIGAVADIFGIDHVLYIMSLLAFCFGLWSLYYERKHADRFTVVRKEVEVEELEPDTVTS